MLSPVLEAVVWSLVLESQVQWEVVKDSKERSDKIRLLKITL